MGRGYLGWRRGISLGGLSLNFGDAHDDCAESLVH